MDDNISPHRLQIGDTVPERSGGYIWLNVHRLLIILLWSFYCLIGISFLVMILFVTASYNGRKGILDTGNVTGWENNENISRNAKDYILKQNESVSSSNNDVIEHICPSNDPPFVLLVVCSAIRHKELRLAIRKTWAKDSFLLHKISVAFLVGKSVNKKKNKDILQEQYMYNDLIIEDFIDTYNNLTLKTLFMLKWAFENCNKTQYIFKSDDDVYINIYRLATFLNSISQEEKQDLLVGKLLTNGKPILDPTSKWYLPRYLYPYELYPKFLSGVGYLMNIKVARRLYNVSTQIKMIHIEDVFLTGLCAELAGVEPVLKEEFDYIRVPSLFECKESYKSLILLSHYVRPSNMYTLHNRIMQCPFLFRRQNHTRVKRNYSSFYF